MKTLIDSKDSESLLSESVDLTEWASPVENQLQLGSCTAQAIVGAYELLLRKNFPAKFVDLSRLFVYYNSRLTENDVDADVGAYIRDGIEAVSIYGVCNENIWPYNVNMFTVKPSESAYQDAHYRKLKHYNNLSTNVEIVEALTLGLPVVVGVFLFDSFNDITKSRPILNMPRANEKTDGGHAMCVTGYDSNTRLFKVRNSFGTDWGDNGYCYIPFDYASEFFSDCWTFDILLTNPSYK